MGVVGKEESGACLKDGVLSMEDKTLAGEMFSFITGKWDDAVVLNVLSRDTGLGISDASLLDREKKKTVSTVMKKTLHSIKNKTKC